MTEGRGERDTEVPDVTIHNADDLVGDVAGGGSGERATGTPNTIYGLSSLFFTFWRAGLLAMRSTSKTPRRKVIRGWPIYVYT